MIILKYSKLIIPLSLALSLFSTIHSMVTPNRISALEREIGQLRNALYNKERELAQEIHRVELEKQQSLTTDTFEKDLLARIAKIASFNDLLTLARTNPAVLKMFLNPAFAAKAYQIIQHKNWQSAITNLIRENYINNANYARDPNSANTLAFLISVSNNFFQTFFNIETKKLVIQLFQNLAPHGLNINSRDANGATILMAAADADADGLPEDSAFLASLGADVNAQDNAGNTPAMYAVQTILDPAKANRRFNIPMKNTLEALLNVGADLAIKNAKGQSAIDVVKEFNNSGAISRRPGLATEFRELLEKLPTIQRD